MNHDTPAVLVTRHDTVAVLQLNRADNRNSMTPELLDAFAAAVAEVRRQPDVRCVVVTGSGPSFSAGADFKSAIQRSDDGAGRLPGELSFAMYEPFLSLLELEVPVIGALQGHAVGGGFGLALVTDFRIACRDARYGANFCKIGLAPGMAISYLLPRLVGLPRASELLYTGRLFSGSEGVQFGLFSDALPADEVLPRAMALAHEIADNAPMAVRMTKRLMFQGLGWQPREAAWREGQAQAQTVATDDVREGMAALLAKRKPVFRGR